MEIVLYADSVIQVTTTRLISRGSAYPTLDIHRVTVSSLWDLQSLSLFLRHVLAFALPLFAVAVGALLLVDAIHWLPPFFPVALFIAVLICLAFMQVRSGERSASPVTYMLEIAGDRGTVLVLSSTDKAYINMLADTVQLAARKCTTANAFELQLQAKHERAVTESLLDDSLSPCHPSAEPNLRVFFANKQPIS
ncbi:MAG: DUF6232 family protein [Chloroflexota bacterium]|nr:DUF6232 family protein [Chloroflexota bacterium]